MSVTSADEVPAPVLPKASSEAKASAKSPRWFRRKSTSDLQLPDGQTASETEIESFIPVPRSEITAKLSRPELWAPGQAGEVKRFFRYLTAWRHITYNELLDRLDSSYDLFSPDSDIRVDLERAQDDVTKIRTEFLTLMRRLLVHANFTEIPRAALTSLLTRESVYGLDLHVDFDDYEEIMVFWRGNATNTRIKRLPIRFWKRKEIEYPVYRRLFLLLKLKAKDKRLQEMMREDGISLKKARKQLAARRKMLPVNADDEAIYVKIFKDIPHADMEMMFPNTRVKMRGKDKWWLSVTAGGSLGGAIVGPAIKIMAATSMLALSPMTMVMAGLGLAGVASRQVGNVMSQRRQYMAVLAQNLYFHTLADNRAAITLLASRAEEEDVKEEMLLYSVLAKEHVSKHELTDLKDAIVGYLQREYQVTVDFDVEEALGRLIKDKIVTVQPDGSLKALSPADGIAHLDSLWDGYLDPAKGDRTLIDEPD
jgi:Protein of unknown function (DUF3754)